MHTGIGNGSSHKAIIWLHKTPRTDSTTTFFFVKTLQQTWRCGLVVKTGLLTRRLHVWIPVHVICELSPLCPWASVSLICVLWIKASIFVTKLQILTFFLGVHAIAFQCFMLVEFNSGISGNQVFQILHQKYANPFLSCDHHSFERSERRFLFCQH